MSTYTPLVDNLHIYEGDDIVLNFVSRLDSLTGYTISFQVRNEISSRYAIVNLPGLVTGGNTYSITIPSVSTITHGKVLPYYYGIKLTSPNGEIHTDRHGQIRIEPRTTDLTQTVVTHIYGVDVDKDGNTITPHARMLNFKGSGVSVLADPVNSDVVDVTIEVPKVSPTLALHFAGIYDTLQNLIDAIPTPSDNMQAIVISPSEKYYHSVGATWVELAPVGSLHPRYLGVYDTVADLKIAQPSPVDNSLAIIGVVDKSFYIYSNGQWNSVTHTDLPSIQADLTDLKSKVATAQQDINSLKTISGINSNAIAAIYAPDKTSFDSKVSALVKPTADGLTNTQTTVAQQGAKLTTQAATISGMENTLNGINTTFNNLRTNLTKAIIGFHVDDAAKTITFNQLDGGSIICDISGMFGAATVQYDIYYGFSVLKVLTPLIIESGTKQSTHTLNGLDIHMTRSDSTSKYMFFWKPDTLPDVKGFLFSGFLDTWSSIPLTVNGVVGKAYVSDNSTHSQDVTFEVVI